MTNTEALLVGRLIEGPEIRGAIQTVMREECEQKIKTLRSAVRNGQHDDAVRIEAEMATLESVVTILERAATKYRTEK